MVFDFSLEIMYIWHFKDQNLTLEAPELSGCFEIYHMLSKYLMVYYICLKRL